MEPGAPPVGPKTTLLCALTSRHAPAIIRCTRFDRAGSGPQASTEVLAAEE